MKYIFSWAVLILFLISPAAGTQGSDKGKQNLNVEVIKKEAEKKVEIIIAGKFFTSYCWPDNVYKPVLYPVKTSEGTEITRGFPLFPREGERNDHIHQVGIWLNYGQVNGLDFWGNGHRGVKEPEGGEIKHKSIEKASSGKGEGVLITRSGWLDPAGKELLDERTEFYFSARGSLRIIDRISTLKAGTVKVVFDDTKEGMFGIRVARQLELPAKGMVAFLDASGKPSAVKTSSEVGATGNYRSSEGITGDAVWGTRAKWMNLYGNIGEEKISIAVCDHPKNQSYPTYWHARNYGLFAANPFGWKDFTKGKETLTFTLDPGESVIFRYRVIVNSGPHLTDVEINKLAEEFSKKY